MSRMLHWLNPSRFRRQPAAPTRQELLLKHVTRDALGLEIGPHVAPLAPKAAGYNCLSLDVIDTEEARRLALADAHVPNELVSRLEPVDIVGSAVDVGDLVTAKVGEHALDYILSSHNFEHIPDPIRFLQGCARALKPGGHLSMALPDLRCSIDHFRWPSVLGDWLEAYGAGRQRPTNAQFFAATSNMAFVRGAHGLMAGWSIDVPRDSIVPERRMTEAYQEWSEFHAAPSVAYRDCHCSTFTPASVTQLLLEARFVGLITLDVEEVTNLHGGEFFVHLRSSDDGPPSAEAFYRERERLARRAIREIALKAAPID